MASGNSLVSFEATDNRAPAADYAKPDVRNLDPILVFDAGTAFSAVFSAVLPRHYAGGGITVRLGWRAASATSGDVMWTVSWERQDAALDTDADSFATAVAGTASTAAGTSGFTIYKDIACTNGAQIDGLLTGERFRLKITRDAAAGGDTMTGDSQLVSVELRET